MQPDPQGTSDAVIIALAFFSLIGTVVTAILAYLATTHTKKVGEQVTNLSVAVNGRLTQLLERTAVASHAEGVAEERAISNGSPTTSSKK